MRDLHATVSGEVHILKNILNQPYAQYFSQSKFLMYITSCLKLGGTSIINQIMQYVYLCEHKLFYRKK